MASVEGDRDVAEVTYGLYEHAEDLDPKKHGDAARVLALLAAHVELGLEARFAAWCQVLADTVAEEEAIASNRRDS